MLCEHNILHQNSIQAQDEWVVEVANNNIKKILQKIMDTIKIGMRNFVCIARLSNIYSFFHLDNIIFFCLRYGGSLTSGREMPSTEVM